MSGSLSQWLRLREPADVAARSEALTGRIVEAVAPADPLHVLDLATGTGSNLRYLADRLPGRQHWLVVDADPALLSEVPARTSSWAVARGYDVQSQGSGCLIRGPRIECHVRTRPMNLDRLDDAGIFAGRQLVTASALLDLVSEPWLRALAARCRAVGAAALFTITYNGRSSCSPAETDDELVRGLMNRHQKRDKGIGGPAAGPDAAGCAERCLQDAGYVVRREPSDWALGPDDHECQRQLIEGWAEAATDLAPDLASRIARWKERRLAHVAAGRSRVVVGHEDLGAWLPRG